jgi:hypothetical protein
MEEAAARSRTIVAQVCGSGNTLSRAYPARGRRRLPPVPGDLRNRPAKCPAHGRVGFANSIFQQTRKIGSNDRIYAPCGPRWRDGKSTARGRSPGSWHPHLGPRGSETVEGSADVVDRKWGRARGSSARRARFSLRHEFAFLAAFLDDREARFLLTTRSSVFLVARDQHEPLRVCSDSFVLRARELENLRAALVLALAEIGRPFLSGPSSAVLCARTSLARRKVASFSAARSADRALRRPT